MMEYNGKDTDHRFGFLNRGENYHGLVFRE